VARNAYKGGTREALRLRCRNVSFAHFEAVASVWFNGSYHTTTTQT
jgi:hypothetical protein